MFFTKPPRTLVNLFSLKKYFIRIAKLCICIVLFSISEIFMFINILIADILYINQSSERPVRSESLKL